MKTYCFKLYRSKKNKKLHRLINIAGQIYNHLIALHKRYYGLYGKHLNVNKLMKHITKLKKQRKFAFWNQLGSQAIQDIAQRIERNYKLFFENQKRGIKSAPPSFKKVKKYKSFTLKQAGYWLLEGNKIVITSEVYKYSKSRDISDLITLLLIFFIVMYTISSVNMNKFAQVVQALGRTLDGSNYIIGQYAGPSQVEGAAQPSETSAQETDNIPDNTDEGSQVQSNLGAISEMLHNFIKENNLGTDISYFIDSRGLVINLNEVILFDSGSADIKERQRYILVQIGKMLKPLPNFIRVEGHTDNRPIYNSRFHSNWELSVIRATNVVEVLVKDAGVAPDRISAVGYGEFRPIVPNDSPKNMQMNRRVDIVIMNPSYDKWEPNSTGK